MSQNDFISRIFTQDAFESSVKEMGDDEPTSFAQAVLEELGFGAPKILESKDVFAPNLWAGLRGNILFWPQNTLRPYDTIVFDIDATNRERLDRNAKRDASQEAGLNDFILGLNQEKLCTKGNPASELMVIAVEKKESPHASVLKNKRVHTVSFGKTTSPPISGILEL